jgi:hypothetical protein
MGNNPCTCGTDEKGKHPVEDKVIKYSRTPNFNPAVEPEVSPENTQLYK